MNDIKQEFLELVYDEGAFSKLSAAVEEVRDILLRYDLNDYEEQRIGHCGVAGEFLNGFYFAKPNLDMMVFDGDDAKNYDVSSYIKRLFECCVSPSQLAQSKEDIAGEYFNNETSFDSIPRAVNDTREWADKHESLTNEHKLALTAHLNDCESSYAELKAFVGKHKSSYPISAL